MIAYILEYDWALTERGWTLRSGDHHVVLEEFQFRQTDAGFLISTLTPASFQTMKAYLDQNGLTPLVFNVLPSNWWHDGYCVLRFAAGQERDAALAKLFCS